MKGQCRSTSVEISTGGKHGRSTSGNYASEIVLAGITL